MRYNYGRGTATLQLEELFPRSKQFLNSLWRLILTNMEIGDRDAAISQMIDYLRNEKIPHLPEELEHLDDVIARAYHEKMMTRPKSIARMNAEREWRLYKSRKNGWDAYCKKLDMNLKLLEGWVE